MRADAINRFADLLQRDTEPLVAADRRRGRHPRRRLPQHAGRWARSRCSAGMPRWPSRAPAAATSRRCPLYDTPVASGSLLRYEPVGVIACLPAYNYPLNLLVWKLGGALASGCTTVVLPSPQGMWSTLRDLRAARRGRPARRSSSTSSPADPRSASASPATPTSTWSPSPAPTPWGQGHAAGRPRLGEQGGPRARRQEPQHRPARRGPGRDRGRLDPALRPQRRPGLRGLEPSARARGPASTTSAGSPTSSSPPSRSATPSRRTASSARSSPPPIATRSRAGSRSCWAGGASWGAGGGRPEGLEKGHYLQPGPAARRRPRPPAGRHRVLRADRHHLRLPRRRPRGRAGQQLALRPGGNVFGPLDQAIEVAKRAARRHGDGQRRLRHAPRRARGAGPVAAAWAASSARTAMPSSSRSSTSSTPSRASPARPAPDREPRADHPTTREEPTTMLLKDKVALVTAGASGHGPLRLRALRRAGRPRLRRRRQRGGGPEVVAGIEAQGGSATAAAVDVRDLDALKALADQVTAEHGRLDVLYNNVGIPGAAGLDMTRRGVGHRPRDQRPVQLLPLRLPDRGAQGGRLTAR